MNLKTANEIIASNHSSHPIDYLEPKQITIQMKEALAQAYAIPGFKEYLENSYNTFIRNSAMHTDNMEALLLRKGRIATIGELLVLSRSCYSDYLTLKKIAKK